MASVNVTRPAQWNMVASERRFFFGMAIAIAVTVIFGFTLNAARMNWTFFELPPHVHLHAAAFFAWIMLYVVQNWVIVRGSITRHRQLGVLGAAIAVSMVVLGIVTTVAAVQQHRVPPFFPPGIFLALDVLGVIGFGILTAWAIALRKQAAWHKRLMLCGTILVMSPALGRILPMPLLGKFAPLAVFASMAVYVIAGMIFDLRLHGKIHPAYFWGGGVLAVTNVLVGPLGFSPPVQRLVERLAA
ncbi:hypothetical protein HMP09_3173 [Sphingomonas sp. HMP9]|uniref:hypothetical protein n=1 Tax=Sphingomonas sp. HMP9 TaxID=1517554 RepID=UPI0015966D3F|nr:hypothetical protein [Sphingomonas sp. HMP9]BCA63939.1 hypothetical protein HMP09_3173 [Sphingomonas sp. HMP9]